MEIRPVRTVVITTIFGVTDSIRAFSALEGWRVILVGDRKTPELAREPASGIEYLSLEAQRNSGFALARKLPVDHYARKCVGYLYAMLSKAEMIWDSDDDNAPLTNRDTAPGLNGSYEVVESPKIVNAYKLFTDAPIWPRGYPLQRIRDKSDIVSQMKSVSKVSVWQGLAAGEPDVDAVYRLVNAAPVEFRNRAPVVLGRGVYSPVNSQNTIWYPAAFPYMYLPATVSMRFTDILRGYVAQRGMHASGQLVGFTSPTVYQERNAHDLMEDFEAELSCYIHAERLVSILDDLQLTGEAHSDLRSMYEALQAEGIVERDELDLVATWLSDINSVQARR